MQTFISREEFERMYLNMIQDRSFLKGIIDRGTFETWIETTVYDNPRLHLKTLQLLKPKLIEFEFYEQVIILDNLIRKIETQINGLESE